jgi:hypothetical protein
MSRTHNIHAHLLRGARRVQIGRVRYYSSVRTAAPKAVQRLMDDGRVGDWLEIFNSETGLQLGTIRKTAKGSIITDFLWEEKE